MTTELKGGGILTKLNIKGYLKDITNNEITKINTKAIKVKNKISYYLDQEKYTLKIISPTKLILKRSTKEIDSIIYFEENKILPSDYSLKDNNLSLNIDIRTDKINLNNEFIKISYTVIDSNNNYEYYIEMSEWYEYKKYYNTYYKM